VAVGRCGSSVLRYHVQPTGIDLPAGEAGGGKEKLAADVGNIGGNQGRENETSYQKYSDRFCDDGGGVVDDYFRCEPSGFRDVSGIFNKTFFGNNRGLRLRELVLAFCQAIFPGRAPGSGNCVGIGSYLAVSDVGQGVNIRFMFKSKSKKTSRDNFLQFWAEHPNYTAAVHTILGLGMGLLAQSFFREGYVSVVGWALVFVGMLGHFYPFVK